MVFHVLAEHLKMYGKIFTHKKKRIDSKFVYQYTTICNCNFNAYFSLQSITMYTDVYSPDVLNFLRYIYHDSFVAVYCCILRDRSCNFHRISVILYNDHPESKDRLDLKKNKQIKNKINVSLLQTLS